MAHREKAASLRNHGLVSSDGDRSILPMALPLEFPCHSIAKNCQPTEGKLALAPPNMSWTQLSVTSPLHYQQAKAQ